MPESLVLLHGFSGTRHAWDRVIGADSTAQRYRPLALDLPGHGETAAAADAPISFRLVRRGGPRRELPSASRCAATRWAGASRCTSRLPRPSASRGWCSSRRARASRTRPSAPRGARPIAASPTSWRADSIRGLHRALARAAAVRRRARRGRRAGARGSAPQRPARARRRAARHRHGGDGAAVGAPGRADDARRRSSPASATRSSRVELARAAMAAPAVPPNRPSCVGASAGTGTSRLLAGETRPQRRARRSKR